MSDLKEFVAALGQDHADHIKHLTNDLDGAKLFAACGVILQQSLGICFYRLHPEDAKKVIEKCFFALEQSSRGNPN
jgi:hypothetical protein